MSTVREFMEHHYLHFNARETLAAAKAYEAHLAAGGKMMVTLSGAMSTARIGRILARMIREDKVHAVTCTGANLEEDIFNLLAGAEYEPIENWRELSAADEAALRDRGMNRVTDTCIPETVMRHLEGRLRAKWVAAAAGGVRKLPSEHLFDVLDDEDLPQHFQIPATDSWMLAAKERQIPVYTPGWEDSTTGNMFSVMVMKGEVSDHACVTSGTEQMVRLMEWYVANHGADAGAPSIGFFQIGGGIAGTSRSAPSPP